MNSFYGNIKNTSRNSFIFDKFYSNRKEMEDNCSTDGVYNGRYVLVNYGEKYETTISSEGMSSASEEYTTNAGIDIKEYQHTYQHTVWQKIWSANTEQYILVAQLDARVPEIEVIGDAPGSAQNYAIGGPNDQTPHIDTEYSTEIQYKLHVPSMWDVNTDTEFTYNEAGFDAAEQSVVKAVDQDNKEVEHNVAYWVEMPTFNSYKKITIKDKAALATAIEKYTWIFYEDQDKRKQLVRNSESYDKTKVYYYGVTTDANTYPIHNGYVQTNYPEEVLKKLINANNTKFYEVKNGVYKLATSYTSGKYYYTLQENCGVYDDQLVLQKNVQNDAKRLVMDLPEIGNTMSDIWDLIYPLYKEENPDKRGNDVTDVGDEKYYSKVDSDITTCIPIPSEIDDYVPVESSDKYEQITDNVTAGSSTTEADSFDLVQQDEYVYKPLQLSPDRRNLTSDYIATDLNGYYLPSFTDTEYHIPVLSGYYAVEDDNIPVGEMTTLSTDVKVIPSSGADTINAINYTMEAIPSDLDGMYAVEKGYWSYEYIEPHDLTSGETGFKVGSDSNYILIPKCDTGYSTPIPMTDNEAFLDNRDNTHKGEYYMIDDGGEKVLVTSSDTLQAGKYYCYKMPEGKPTEETITELKTKLANAGINVTIYYCDTLKTPVTRQRATSGSITTPTMPTTIKSISSSSYSYDSSYYYYYYIGDSSNKVSFISLDGNYGLKNYMEEQSNIVVYVRQHKDLSELITDINSDNCPDKVQIITNEATVPTLADGFKQLYKKTGESDYYLDSNYITKYEYNILDTFYIGFKYPDKKLVTREEIVALQADSDKYNCSNKNSTNNIFYNVTTVDPDKTAQAKAAATALAVKSTSTYSDTTKVILSSTSKNDTINILKVFLKTELIYTIDTVYYAHTNEDGVCHEENEMYLRALEDDQLYSTTDGETFTHLLKSDSPKHERKTRYYVKLDFLNGFIKGYDGTGETNIEKYLSQFGTLFYRSSDKTDSDAMTSFTTLSSSKPLTPSTYKFKSTTDNTTDVEFTYSNSGASTRLAALTTYIGYKFYYGFTEKFGSTNNVNDNTGYITIYKFNYLKSKNFKIYTYDEENDEYKKVIYTDVDENTKADAWSQDIKYYFKYEEGNISNNNVLFNSEYFYKSSAENEADNYTYCSDCPEDEQKYQYSNRTVWIKEEKYYRLLNLTNGEVDSTWYNARIHNNFLLLFKKLSDGSYQQLTPEDVYSSTTLYAYKYTYGHIKDSESFEEIQSSDAKNGIIYQIVYPTLVVNTLDEKLEENSALALVEATYWDINGVYCYEKEYEPGQISEAKFNSYLAKYGEMYKVVNDETMTKVTSYGSKSTKYKFKFAKEDLVGYLSQTEFESKEYSNIKIDETVTGEDGIATNEISALKQGLITEVNYYIKDSDGNMILATDYDEEQQYYIAIYFSDGRITENFFDENESNLYITSDGELFNSASDTTYSLFIKYYFDNTVKADKLQPGEITRITFDYYNTYYSPIYIKLTDGQYEVIKNYIGYKTNYYISCKGKDGAIFSSDFEDRQEKYQYLYTKDSNNIATLATKYVAEKGPNDIPVPYMYFYFKPKDLNGYIGEEQFNNYVKTFGAVYDTGDCKDHVAITTYADKNTRYFYHPSQSLGKSITKLGYISSDGYDSYDILYYNDNGVFYIADSYDPLTEYYSSSAPGTRHLFIGNDRDPSNSELPTTLAGLIRYVYDLLGLKTDNDYRDIPPWNTIYGVLNGAKEMLGLPDDEVNSVNTVPVSDQGTTGNIKYGNPDGIGELTEDDYNSLNNTGYGPLYIHIVGWGVSEEDGTPEYKDYFTKSTGYDSDINNFPMAEKTSNGKIQYYRDFNSLWALLKAFQQAREEYQVDWDIIAPSDPTYIKNKPDVIFSSKTTVNDWTGIYSYSTEEISELEQNLDSNSIEERWSSYILSSNYSEPNPIYNDQVKKDDSSESSESAWQTEDGTSLEPITDTEIGQIFNNVMNS